jgi:hypothetical protein
MYATHKCTPDTKEVSRNGDHEVRRTEGRAKFYEGGYGALTVQVRPNIEVFNSRPDEFSRKRSF